MNKRKEQALEVFLYVTFAIALVVGVGNSNGETNLLSASFETNEHVGNAEIEYGQGSTNRDTHEDVQLQSTLTFASGDDKVNALGRLELAKHAKILRDNPYLILTLIGYSGSGNSASYNQRLSEKRATRVYEWLVYYGAPKDQLIVDTYGEVRSTNRGENRRVDLQYSSLRMARSGD